MKISRIECKLYNYNIFVLEDVQFDYCWLVDIGTKDFIVPNGKKVRGVFITHTHIDHILGINELLTRYPDCIVYVNEAGKEGLFNDKINLTFYHGTPLCFVGGNLRIIKEGDKVQLFNNEVMEVIETPGHHPSCTCYKNGNYLFTGDSYIPGFSIVTKLKGGNREQSIVSEKRIKSLIEDNITIICPGHGDIIYASSQ